MLKPVTTAYLNYHIKDDTNRAFINSMSNPAGGLVVAFVCIALILTNDSARAPNTSDVLLIFLIPAILALVAIVLATSAKKEAKNA